MKRKQEVAGGGVAGVGGRQQEKEKNGQVRGELNMDGALGLCSE